MFTTESFFIKILYSCIFNVFPVIYLRKFLIYMIENSSIFSSGKSREFLNMGEHTNKKNTPTMGGIIFLYNSIALPLFFYFFKKEYFVSAMFIGIASFGSGLVGLLDDYNKINFKKGISAKLKFYLQATVAFIAAFYFYYNTRNSFLNLGVLKIDLGWLYVAWIILVIISTSHAVNIVDGVDGLAITCFLISIATPIFMQMNLQASVLAGTFIAAPMTFLFLNLYPAKIIMGDVGALYLGAFLACIYIVAKMEILLIFGGLIFVLDTLSVILQVLSIKIFKKRLFSFSPVHHALEKRGYSENKILILFSIINLIGQIITYYLFINFFKI